MRLRPYGESGPLVCSFNALEHYYQVQGREWERYALVKARVLGAVCQDKKYLISPITTIHLSAIHRFQRDRIIKGK